MCILGGRGTPAPLWLVEHAGLDMASHEAALVRGSNEASLELERYRSSTGLRGKAGRGLKQRHINSASKITHEALGEPFPDNRNVLGLPVTGLRRRRTEDGLRISARYL